MVRLLPYDASFQAATIKRMAAFFGFHESLAPSGTPQGGTVYPAPGELRSTLDAWQAQPSALYVIMRRDASVGFLRLCYRGPTVAWIEDLFVDAAHRGQGIATAAISAAERIVLDTPGYTAVCMDVAPRNADALRLYHRLGYTDLSLITIRKALTEPRRSRTVRLFGLDFNC